LPARRQCYSNGRRRWNRGSGSSSKSWIGITSIKSVRSEDLESTLGQFIKVSYFYEAAHQRDARCHFARGSIIPDLPACSSSMRLIMRLRQIAQSMPSIPRSRRLYAISLHGLNIAFSSLLLLTTGTRTAPARCWKRGRRLLWAECYGFHGYAISCVKWLPERVTHSYMDDLG
jgi:hypothetical protein